MGSSTFDRRSFVRLGCALALLIGTAGCNEELQKDTGTFLDALEKGDYAAFKSVATKSLQDDFTEEKFLQASATYQMMGKLKDKTRTQTKVRNGVRSIDYTLTMEKGDLHLFVSSQGDDNIDSFKLDGKAWEEATQRLLEDRVGKLVDALIAKDTAAVTALLGPEAKKDFEANSASSFAVLGAAGSRKSIGSVDTSQGSALVDCENGSYSVKINMQGGKIAGFGVEAK